MLYFPQTRIENSVARALAAGVTVPAEGCALVNSLIGGVFGVKASTGGAGEVFAGVAVDQVTTVLQQPKFEELTLGASNTLALAQTPIAGTISVVDMATNTALTAGTVDATHYSISGNVVTLDASNVGKKYRVAYQYAPTGAQLLHLQGNTLPGGPAGAYLGQVGVITRGDVYTSHFDTSANWSAAVGVTMGANGVFKPEPVAANCMRGVQIIELPSAARAFLGLNINASV